MPATNSAGFTAWPGAMLSRGAVAETCRDQLCGTDEDVGQQELPGMSPRAADELPARPAGLKEYVGEIESASAELARALGDDHARPGRGSRLARRRQGRAARRCAVALRPPLTAAARGHPTLSGPVTAKLCVLATGHRQNPSKRLAAVRV